MFFFCVILTFHIANAAADQKSKEASNQEKLLKEYAKFETGVAQTLTSILSKRKVVRLEIPTVSTLNKKTFLL